MKKLVLAISLAISYTFAQNVGAPPSFPSFDIPKIQQKTKKQNSLCEDVPPMLHILPPPLQEALDKCQNEKFIPTIEKAKEYLTKNKIKYKNITIKPTEGFVRVYEVDLGNGKKIYCNEHINKCLP